MFELSGAEIVGYVASALVVLSLTMTSVVRLRIISLIGSIAFVIYGSLIGSAPIVITNVSIAAINIWFLRKEFATRSATGIDLGASQIRPDSPFLLDFIQFHHEDINSFQPDFQMPTGDNVFSLLLTRDGLPAGLLVGRRDGDALTVDLDYVLGRYRDSRLGRWLFSDGADVFRQAGIRTLRAEGGTDMHCRYLKRTGFSPTTDDWQELHL